MAFSQGILIPGRPVYQLSIEAETGTYNVESVLVSTYGVSSTANALIILIVTGDRTSDNTSTPAINATGLHDEAQLIIDLQDADINGKGGNGGRGGLFFDPPEPGAPNIVRAPGNGKDGGNAIDLGCPTTIKGTGTIRAGFAGGGGALGVNAGDGGGGGAASGTGGNAGADQGVSGTDGSDATVTVKGDAGGVSAGDGGDEDNAAEDGDATAGDDGYTVLKDEFALTKIGSVTYKGSEGT